MEFPAKSRRTWQRTLARAKVPYVRIYDLRSTYATRLSAGGVADECVTQVLRQRRRASLQEVFSDEVADEREALEKMNRQASEMQSHGSPALCTAMLQ
jgi:integrase